jgi:hypothetical protein
MLVGNTQHFLNFLQRQRAVAALLENMFDRIDDGLRNSILREQLKLTVFKAQAQTIVLFNRFNVTV